MPVALLFMEGCQLCGRSVWAGTVERWLWALIENNNEIQRVWSMDSTKDLVRIRCQLVHGPGWIAKVCSLTIALFSLTG